MRTLEQYREDVAKLLEQAGNIRAKAENQNRDLTAEEVSHIGDVNEEVKRLQGMIDVLAETDGLVAAVKETPAPQAQPQTMPKARIQFVADNSKKERFASLGEQLMATIRAAQPGVKIDPRLFTAAASGLNETTPAEGGFLVQTDFSSDLLQQVFETGILAPRCRRYTISSGANAITINGVDETSRASTRSGGVLGYWIDEAQEKTATKPKFRQIELKLKKLIGLCYATDELLNDASALEAFIRSAFAAEFGFLLDDAIIRGTGGAQPLVTDFQSGIKTVIYYQRKSGDVTTFIGNSFIIAACVASILPLDKCVKAAFCGDDSLVYMPVGLEYPDIQTAANLVWNFEAKLFKKRFGYFCGKYIIHHKTGCVVYPDPLKLIGKLGAKNITDWNHLEEFRISLMDVSRSLFNSAYHHLLDDAIHEVFPHAGGCGFVINSICKYLSDKRLFRNLFIECDVNK